MSCIFKHRWIFRKIRWEKVEVCQEKRREMIRGWGVWGVFRAGEVLAVGGDPSLVGCDLWSLTWCSGSMKQIRAAAIWPLSSREACDPSQADPRLCCFRDGIPSLPLMAVWKSCLWSVLSEGNLRHLLSVKLIMLQSTECLGALNPECSADLM